MPNNYPKLNITICLGLLCFFILMNSVTAQPWHQNDVIFNPSGVPSLPFSQPRFADLDNDGDYDMILGSLDDKPYYFENIGTSINPVFKEDVNVFTDVSSLDAEMGVCADLDNDGDQDLITAGYGGLSLFANLGDVYNPFFEKTESIFKSLSIGENPIPSFGDVDNDGDLDLLIGLSESGLLKLYYNSGTADSASFSESLVEELTDIGLYAYPCLYDLDDDNDLDIIAGRDGHGFYYYKNIGDSIQFNWQLDPVPFSGLGSDTYWNSPGLVDLNGDSKVDLVYGTSAGPLHYFKNTGSTSTPVWSRNSSLFGGVLDVGGASSPFFFDFDLDGDLDLVSGSNLGGIKYFKNIGSKTGAAWQESNGYFSSIKHSIYSALSIGDVNGDSLPDALVGDLNGGLYFHRNTGSGFVYESSVLSEIDLGDWSAPKLLDMDFDTDLDIVAGNDAGMLFYFENQGSPDSASWIEISSYFGNIDVGSNCVPALADVDGDGDCDLVTGNISGTVRYFQNDEGTWTERPEVVSGVSGGQNTAPAFADLDNDTDFDLTLGNYDGTFNYFENVGATFIEKKDTIASPSGFLLTQVYPNPFNGTIMFQGVALGASVISLDILNLLGQKVHSNVILSSPGKFQHQVHFPQYLSSGVYLYNIHSDLIGREKKISGKIIYMK